MLLGEFSDVTGVNTSPGLGASINSNLTQWNVFHCQTETLAPRERFGLGRYGLENFALSSSLDPRSLAADVGGAGGGVAGAAAVILLDRDVGGSGGNLRGRFRDQI